MIEKRNRKGRNGRGYHVYRVRWRDELGRERSRTFDRTEDARAFEARVRTLKRTEDLARLDSGKETLAEFAADWWRLHATPELERNTLLTYASLWNSHALPRLGGYRLRDITPMVVVAFRTDLEAAGVGREAARKTMTMLQGMLQRAVEWQRIDSNPFSSVRKPAPATKRAVRPLSPATVEELRQRVSTADDPRDATLVSVLAYAGLRPQEALALEWRHVRERTLLIEQALADGELKGQKTGRPPRTVDLLAPLKQDLREWRLRQGRPPADAFVFPTARGGPWREHDWRNWRKRVYARAAAACGIDGARPYDLRHSFASLLIHDGRHSIVDIAAQLGHDPTMTLSTYGHVMAELREAPRRSAEEEIRAARERVTQPSRAAECGPNVAHEPVPGQLSLLETPDLQEALCRTRTDDPFLTMEVLYQLS
jgi:integrase